MQYLYPTYPLLIFERDKITVTYAGSSSYLYDYKDVIKILNIIAAANVTCEAFDWLIYYFNQFIARPYTENAPAMILQNFYCTN